MLKLNVNQEREVSFEAQMDGVQAENLKCYLRIVINEIEYGFPAKIGNEYITVTIPPLKKVVAGTIVEGEEAVAKLQLIGDDKCVTPWQEKFLLTNPLVVEAKMVGQETPIKSVKASLVSESHTPQIIEREPQLPSIQMPDEDVLVEKIISKLTEKFSSQIPKKAKPAKKILQKVKTESKSISPKSLLNITEEEVYAYMERAGTKNKQIQKIVYEQAEAAAKSSKPVEVLKQVVKIIKTKN